MRRKERNLYGISRQFNSNLKVCEEIELPSPFHRKAKLSLAHKIFTLYSSSISKLGRMKGTICIDLSPHICVLKEREWTPSPSPPHAIIKFKYRRRIRGFGNNGGNKSSNFFEPGEPSPASSGVLIILSSLSLDARFNFEWNVRNIEGFNCEREFFLETR